MIRCTRVLALAFVVFVVGGASTLALLATDDRPAVVREVVLSPDNIERVKGIVDRHRYRVRRGTVGSLTIRPDDADIVANYLVHRFFRGTATVAFRDGSADVAASLPVLAGRRYFNISATLVDTTAIPVVRQVRIGHLPLPDWMTEAVMPRVMDSLRRTPELRAGLDALRSVRFFRHGTHVSYLWDGVPDDVRAQMVSEADRRRLRLAQDRLRSVLIAAHAGPNATLSEVLVPLMQHAARRSVDGDAVAENRAAILVAMFHVMRKSLKLVVPEAVHWPRPPRQSVTLDGREDFAKHFAVSAAISAYADTALADAVGLYKEIEDSRTGSGFSFNDLAADRAGTRFGELAAAPDTAIPLHARVAAGVRDTDVMPPWQDLPESLPEAEFKRRFGGVEAPAYRALMEEIERRVARLPVLH